MKTAAGDTERAQFNEFINGRGGDAILAFASNPDDRERLYRDFLIWKQARERP
jgi:beta-glucanase (GH16 family)